MKDNLLTFKEFKNELSFFTQLTEEQLKIMYELHRNNEVICVTGKQGPAGKSSLVKRLNEIGVQAVEVYAKDLIILDRLVREI